MMMGGVKTHTHTHTHTHVHTQTYKDGRFIKRLKNNICVAIYIEQREKAKERENHSQRGCFCCNGPGEATTVFLCI